MRSVPYVEREHPARFETLRLRRAALVLRDRRDRRLKERQQLIAERRADKKQGARGRAYAVKNHSWRVKM